MDVKERRLSKAPNEGTLSEKAKILFRPGEDLTQMLTSLTYQKIKTK